MTKPRYTEKQAFQRTRKDLEELPGLSVFAALPPHVLYHALATLWQHGSETVLIALAPLDFQDFIQPKFQGHFIPDPKTKHAFPRGTVGWFYHHPVVILDMPPGEIQVVGSRHRLKIGVLR